MHQFPEEKTNKKVARQAATARKYDMEEIAI
jgi:hypothetical protein